MRPVPLVGPAGWGMDSGRPGCFGRPWKVRLSMMRVSSAVLVVVFACASACGPRPEAAWPASLRPEAVSGPSEWLWPAAGPPGSGPRGTALDIEAVALPRDPAALPSQIVRWERATAEPGPFGGPHPRPVAVWAAGGMACLLDDDSGVLIGASLADGRPRWAVALPPREVTYHDVPWVGRDGVLYGARDRTLVAVDLSSGRIAWRTEAPGSPDEALFVVRGRAIVRLIDAQPSDPADRRSAPEFVNAAIRIAAFDAGSGRIEWVTDVGGGPGPPAATVRLGVSADFAVVAAVATTGTTEILLLRISDGTRAASTVLNAWAGQPLADGDTLVLPVARTVDGRETHLLAGLRLPSLDPAWELPLDDAPTRIHLTGADVLLATGRSLVLIDVASGREVAARSLDDLASPSAEAAEDEPGIDCVAAAAPAGDSIVYATEPWCSPGHLGFLDARTLRPWRIVEGFDVPVGALLADAGTAVVDLPTGVVAIDLRSAGRPLRERRSFAERIEDMAREIEAGRLALGFPLDRRAGEFALGGDAVGSAVVDALEHGSAAQRLFAAAVLRHRPGTGAVPALVAAFGPPAGIAEEMFLEDVPSDAILERALVGRVLDALAVSGDPRVTDLLAGVMLDATAWSGNARSSAMQGLAAIGTPDALGRIDFYVQHRSRRGLPWRPLVAEGTAGRRHDDAGAFVVGNSGCAPGMRDPGRAVSSDGKLVALVANAAGGPADVWLIRDVPGPRGGLFTDVTSPFGLEIVAVEGTPDGARVTARRTQADRRCSRVVCVEGPPDDAPEETFVFRWTDLERDADGDGWSDLLERRLRTDSAKADTDGDGLGDPFDPAPRGSGHGIAQVACVPRREYVPADPDTGRGRHERWSRCPEPPADDTCARQGVFTAAFLAVFAFADDRIPVFVEGPAEVNLQYEGYSGPAIYLAPYEADALRGEVGLDGATYFRFDSPHEEGPDGAWRPAGGPLDAVRFSADGALATIDVSEYRGRLNAVGRRIVLRCHRGLWYPLSIRVTRVS